MCGDFTCLIEMLGDNEYGNSPIHQSEITGPLQVPIELSNVDDSLYSVFI